MLKFFCDVNKTVIIWDVKACPIPEGLDSYDIWNNVQKSLSNIGYPTTHILEFRAYCDYFLTDDSRPSGPYIPLMHASSGDSKEAEDERRKKILVDLLCEAGENRSRINLLLIIGDVSEQTQFMRALKFLKEAKPHNVFLALPRPPSSEDLVATVREVWLWETLAVGGYPMGYIPSEDDSDYDSSDD
ncbi:PREDICTED: uncharacterized protein LOC104708242 isoform X1 [Camelina sativa]|uniref:Uncharacterized protein LOC104708242 isoform X1 n=1 Tax=Camelina sativa TaxID=90675 RepID=A0ABM0T9Y9_CAMSA|nr:PREDICTED: uncharacterized protein LOC104708242 isoform X1 [Camelina sativa]